MRLLSTVKIRGLRKFIANAIITNAARFVIYAKINVPKGRRKTNVRAGKAAFRSRESPAIWGDGAVSAAVRRGKKSVWDSVLGKMNVVQAAKTTRNAPLVFVSLSSLTHYSGGQTADFFLILTALHKKLYRHRAPYRPKYNFHQAGQPYHQLRARVCRLYL